MIKFKLGYRKYKIPTSYTLEQWKEIVRLDFEDPRNWPKIMGIATNLPAGKFINANEDSLILGASLVLSEMSKRHQAPHRDFTKLTLGQFIDLDIWLQVGIQDHLEDILELLGTGKKYTANEALYIVDQYSNFRYSTYRSYSGLFGLNQSGEQEDVDPEEWNPKKVATNWYKVLVDLADNDLLKLDPITDQPLYKALTFMSLRKERLLAEQKKLLKKQLQHDVPRNRK